MLDTVQAVTFIKKMSNGKTMPLLMQCLQENNNLIDVVVKLSCKCERKEIALASEAVCSMLATDLGLLTPEPFLVEINPNVINQELFPEIYDDISNSSRIAFGSKLLPNNFGIFNFISDSNLQSAMDIFSFDALILNSDRRENNPNCKSDGHSIAIFDHDIALSSTNDLGSSFLIPYPWDIGALNHMKAGNSKHILYKYLHNKNMSINKFENEFLKLGPLRLEKYINALPQEWVAKKDIILSIVEYLELAIQKWSFLRLEIERVLNA